MPPQQQTDNDCENADKHEQDMFAQAPCRNREVGRNRRREQHAAKGDRPDDPGLVGRTGRTARQLMAAVDGHLDVPWHANNPAQRPTVWNATRHAAVMPGAGRALHHFYAGQMEGPLQLAVSRRLPRPLAGPDPRYVTGGYRRAAARPSLSFEVVNERLNDAGVARLRKCRKTLISWPY